MNGLLIAGLVGLFAIAVAALVLGVMAAVNSKPKHIVPSGPHPFQPTPSKPKHVAPSSSPKPSPSAGKSKHIVPGTPARMRAAVGQYPGCPAGMTSFVMDDPQAMVNNNMGTISFPQPVCVVWPEGTPVPSGGLKSASWLLANDGSAPVTIVDGNTGNAVATMPANQGTQCQMQCDQTLACQLVNIAC